MPIRELAIAFAALSCTPSGGKTASGSATEHWEIGSGSGRVRIEKIDARAVASPEALRQFLGATDPIEHRESLRDGFTATFGGHTHVIRELGTSWYRCTASADNAEQIAQCRSFKRPGD